MNLNPDRPALTGGYCHLYQYNHYSFPAKRKFMNKIYQMLIAVLNNLVNLLINKSVFAVNRQNVCHAERSEASHSPISCHSERNEGSYFNSVRNMQSGESLNGLDHNHPGMETHGFIMPQRSEYAAVNNIFNSELPPASPSLHGRGRPVRTGITLNSQFNIHNSPFTIDN